MSKVIFVIQRRPDLSREQCLAKWSGERHVSVVKNDDDAMTAALNSPEMGAAVEDARTFLDMERAGMIIVDEMTIVG